MSEKIALAGGRYRSILIFFDNKLLADFFIRHPHKFQASTHKNKEEPFLAFEKDAFLTNFTESLGFMLGSSRPLSAELQKVKQEELLLYLGERYPEKIQRLRASSYQTDDNILIRQDVTANINKAVTVEELAFLCHISLFTFKKRFASIYGTSRINGCLKIKCRKQPNCLGKVNAKQARSISNWVMRIYLVSFSLLRVFTGLPLNSTSYQT
jgi:AraC-like DNA-binding protein